MAFLFWVDCTLVLPSLRVGRSDGVPMEPQPRPYCVVTSHIPLEVNLFSQNSTDLDEQSKNYFGGGQLLNS